MSVDAQIDLQTAIYNSLTGDTTLMASINGVFDFVPQETNYPYVTIGNDDYTWFGSMGKDGGQYNVQIDIWTQQENREECKNIMKLVSDFLHNGSLIITNNVHISTRLDFQETVQESDNFTHHGIQRYTIFLHEA